MATILIVEDEGLIADGLKRSLTQLGYTVSGIVSTGQAAIDHVKTARPDVVLMDLTLPGSIDGLEAAQRIRDHVNIPVVFLTARADPTTIARVAAVKPQGYQGYIVKPYSEQELQKTLERVLEQRT